MSKLSDRFKESVRKLTYRFHAHEFKKLNSQVEALKAAKYVIRENIDGLRVDGPLYLEGYFSNVSLSVILPEEDLVKMRKGELYPVSVVADSCTITHCHFDIRPLAEREVVHMDAQRKDVIIPGEGGDLSPAKPTPMSSEDKVTKGRFVSFKLSPEVTRPALVVNDNGEGSLNLQVFLDGTNDRIGALSEVVSQEEVKRGMAWRTLVHEGDEVGQWSRPWVKKEEPKAEIAAPSAEADAAAPVAGATSEAAGTAADGLAPRPSMELKDLARIAFDAYNVQAGGKTWDGKDIPPFDEVGEKVQANWIAAVQAVEAVIKSEAVA